MVILNTSVKLLCLLFLPLIFTPFDLFYWKKDLNTKFDKESISKCTRKSSVPLKSICSPTEMYLVVLK